MPGRGQPWKVGGLNDETVTSADIKDGEVAEVDLTPALQAKINVVGVESDGEGHPLLVEDDSITTPAANEHVLHFKTDGLLYETDENGIETRIGGIGGGGLESLATLTDVTITNSDILLTTSNKMHRHLGINTKHRAFADIFTDVRIFGVNPIFDEDFTEYTDQAAMDIAWVPAAVGGSSNGIVGNPSTNVLDVGRTSVQGTAGATNAIVDLGLALSDSLWTIDFDLTVVSRTVNSTGQYRLLIGPTDQATVGASQTMDWIGLFYNSSASADSWGTSHLDSESMDNIETNVDNNFATDVPSVTTFFFRIRRLTTTTYDIQTFTDAGRGSQSESVGGTFPATVVGLQHLLVHMDNGATISASADFTCTMDNIVIEDGTAL